MVLAMREISTKTTSAFLRQAKKPLKPIIMSFCLNICSFNMLFYFLSHQLITISISIYLYIYICNNKNTLHFFSTFAFLFRRYILNFFCFKRTMVECFRAIPPKHRVHPPIALAIILFLGLDVWFRFLEQVQVFPFDDLSNQERPRHQFDSTKN